MPLDERGASKKGGSPCQPRVYPNPPQILSNVNLTDPDEESLGEMFYPSALRTMIGHEQHRTQSIKQSY
jgi:hypothetical protein